MVVLSVLVIVEQPRLLWQIWRSLIFTLERDVSAAQKISEPLEVNLIAIVCFGNITRPGRPMCDIDNLAGLVVVLTARIDVQRENSLAVY